jgi:hypothetical protein
LDDLKKIIFAKLLIFNLGMKIVIFAGGPGYYPHPDYEPVVFGMRMWSIIKFYWQTGIKR